MKTDPVTFCALCGEALNIISRDAVRFSNTRPPWTVRNAIEAMTDGLGAALRAAQDIPDQTYWFHKTCWDRFSILLNGRD